MGEDGGDKATELRDIYGELDELARKLSRAIAGRLSYKKAEQMGTLALNIAQIRYLLQVLVRGYNQGSAVGLMSRYLHLEGKIKQIRNDLERASRSHDVRR